MSRKLQTPSGVGSGMDEMSYGYVVEESVRPISAGGMSIQSWGERSFDVFVDEEAEGGGSGGRGCIIERVDEGGTNETIEYSG